MSFSRMNTRFFSRDYFFFLSFKLVFFFANKNVQDFFFNVMPKKHDSVCVEYVDVKSLFMLAIINHALRSSCKSDFKSELQSFAKKKKKTEKMGKKHLIWAKCILYVFCAHLYCVIPKLVEWYSNITYLCATKSVTSSNSFVLFGLLNA